MRHPSALILASHPVNLAQVEVAADLLSQQGFEVRRLKLRLQQDVVPHSAEDVVQYGVNRAGPGADCPCH